MPDLRKPPEIVGVIIFVFILAVLFGAIDVARLMRLIKLGR